MALQVDGSPVRGGDPRVIRIRMRQWDVYGKGWEAHGTDFGELIAALRRLEAEK